MINKLKQQNRRQKFTPSNRLPNRRARLFLLNYLRTVRQDTSSAYLRAGMGLLHWSAAHSFRKEDRVAFRAGCFITGRARGTSQRFTVARTCVKQLTGESRLFGVRKSSW